MQRIGWPNAPRSRARCLILSAVLSGLVGTEVLAQEPVQEVGTAIVIKQQVLATLGDDRRDLQEGGRVHRNEYLETGDKAQAEIKLDDQTKLALGPNAGLKLDEFVIGKSGGVTTIGVNFVKGTFRFITGSQKRDAYSIQTPSATIGVRGTVFDVYVDGNGDTLVLLHQGEVDICTRNKTCRRHNQWRPHHPRNDGGHPLRLPSSSRKADPRCPGCRDRISLCRKNTPHRSDPATEGSGHRRAPLTKVGNTVTKGPRDISRTIRKTLPF